MLIERLNEARPQPARIAPGGAVTTASNSSVDATSRSVSPMQSSLANSISAPNITLNAASLYIRSIARARLTIPELIRDSARSAPTLTSRSRRTSMPALSFGPRTAKAKATWLKSAPSRSLSRKPHNQPSKTSRWRYLTGKPEIPSHRSHERRLLRLLLSRGAGPGG